MSIFDYFRKDIDKKKGVSDTDLAYPSIRDLRRQLKNRGLHEVATRLEDTLPQAVSSISYFRKLFKSSGYRPELHFELQEILTGDLGSIPISCTKRAAHSEAEGRAIRGIGSACTACQPGKQRLASLAEGYLQYILQQPSLLQIPAERCGSARRESPCPCSRRSCQCPFVSPPNTDDSTSCSTADLTDEGRPHPFAATRKAN